MTTSEKTKWPGKGLKTAGKVIVIIGMILTAFVVIGGGGGSGLVIGFLIFILPGLIIYGAGRRKYKKAINAPFVAAAKAQKEEKRLQKKMKVKGEGGGGLTVLMIIFFIFSIPVVIYGIITSHMEAFGVGLFFFAIAFIWACIKRPTNHNVRDAFYMNRWGSANAKRNMWRGYKRSKK